MDLFTSAVCDCLRRVHGLQVTEPMRSLVRRYWLNGNDDVHAVAAMVVEARKTDVAAGLR